MATVNTNINLNTATGATVSELTRLGARNNAFLDGSATAPSNTLVEQNGVLTGDRVMIVTNGPSGSGNGMWNLTNSIMWWDSAGGPTDFTGTSQFNFTDGEINYSGTGAPLIRGPSLSNALMNVARTQLNSTSTGSPGLNLAGVSIDSDLGQVVFNGWWLNVIGDLPLIGVNFSNSRFRPISSAYHIRLNPALGETTRGTWIIGSDMSNFGELSGGGNAGFQIFGDIASGPTGTPMRPGANFRGIFLVECTLRAANTLLVNSLENTGTVGARNATIVTMQAWQPRLVNATTPNTDARLKFVPANVTLYDVPTGFTRETDINNLGATSNTTIHPRGYFIRDQELTINNTTQSGTIGYSNLTATNRFLITSYTDLITNGNYFRPHVRSTTDPATGLPNLPEDIPSIPDPFLQTTAESTVNLTAGGNPNHNYRQLKRIVNTSALLYDWSSIVSGHSGGNTITLPVNLTLSSSSDTAITSSTGINDGVEDVTSISVETTPTTWTASTDDGAITSITAPQFDLGGIRIDGVDLTGNVVVPYYSTLAATTEFTFQNSTITGNITVDGNTSGRIIRFAADSRTQASTGMLMRAAGSNTVAVVNRPTGMTLTTGVVDAPVAYTYSGSSGDRISIFNSNGRLLVTGTTDVEVLTDTQYTDGANTVSVSVGDTVYIAHSRRGRIEQFNSHTFTRIAGSDTVTLTTDLNVTPDTLTYNPANSFLPDSDVIWNSGPIAANALGTGSAAVAVGDTLTLRFTALGAATGADTPAEAIGALANSVKDTTAYSRAMYWFNRDLTDAQRGVDSFVITNLSPNGDSTRLFNNAGSGVRINPKIIAGTVTPITIDNVTFPAGVTIADVTIGVSTTGTFGVTATQSSPASPGAISNAVEEALNTAGVATSTELTTARDNINTNVGTELDNRRITRRNSVRTALNIPLLDNDGNLDTDINT